jgi:hypothetical protein
MARARNIKPGFFTNDELAECQPLARILFAGLWTIADREGRLEDRPKKIKAELLPFDNCDMDELLTSLHEQGFITRYSIDNCDYIQITNFIKHQNPHPKEAKSGIPAMPGHVDSGCVPYYVPPAQRQRIFARDEFKCKKCGSTERLSIDHIIPRSKGGTNEDSNLQTLCVYCNSSKGNDLPFTSHEITRQETDKQVENNADSLIPITESLLLNPSNESIKLSGDMSSVDNSDGRLEKELNNTGDENSPDFVAFWNYYPRHSGMSKAIEAWKVIISKGIPPKYLILSAGRYAMHVQNQQTEERFIKMPHTFLQERVYYDYIPKNLPECPRCHGLGNYEADEGGTAICDCRKVLLSCKTACLKLTQTS